MATRIELVLRLPNSPGALAAVCRMLADARVNILALSLDARGELRLVVDNHVHAAGALRDRNHQVEERDVIVLNVPNSPGGVASALRLVADARVNIERAYGGTTEDAARASIVVGVDDAIAAAAAAGV